MRDRRTGMVRYNGGQECDQDDGPCSCGAWHSLEEDRVRRQPIWWSTIKKLALDTSRVVFEGEDSL